MKLTTKRILILFSIFLNIGFVAAAAHHALFFNTHIDGHAVAVEELNKLDIPESDRQTLLDKEKGFHERIKDYISRRRALMSHRLDVMTAPEAPTQAQLDELRAQELELSNERIDGITEMVLEMRGVIGPERTREFIDSLRARRHRKLP